jgi:hypothetical protein
MSSLRKRKTTKYVESESEDDDVKKPRSKKIKQDDDDAFPEVSLL